MIKLWSCFALFFLIYSSSFSQKRNTVLWKNTSTLEENDFKTKRMSDNTWAEINTYFELKQHNLNNEFSLDAIAFSNTKKNYFTKLYLKLEYRTDSLDREVIRHENYHFNITEMYCRYIERDFYEYVKKKARKVKKIQRKLGRIYIKYLTEWKNYERDFDIYTQHSHDIQEHEKWIAKINSELESLKQFENVTIKLIKGKKKYELVGLENNLASSSVSKK